MILYGVTGCLALILVSILGLAAYLWWQSTVKTAPYAVMFEVRPGDPLRVSRVNNGWAIAVSDGLKPVKIRVGAAFDSLDASYAVTAIDGGYWARAERIPASRCFFEIGLEDGRTIRTAERILPLEGPVNFRDLGGYETTDGRRVAWGCVYRADGLDRLTGRDKAVLQELGVRIICDLRTYHEAKTRPDPALDGITNRHMPIFPKDPIGRSGALFKRHRLDAIFQSLYRHHIIDAGAPMLGDVLRLAADTANLPLVIHCAGGKDRTGVASALLLHVCGVPEETIIADYSLTNLAIEKTLSSMRKRFGGAKPPLGFRIDQMYPVLSARPQLIEQALAHIEASYGSVDQYLRGPVGLTEADIDAIRSNLLV